MAGSFFGGKHVLVHSVMWENFTLETIVVAYKLYESSSHRIQRLTVSPCWGKTRNVNILGMEFEFKYAGLALEQSETFCIPFVEIANGFMTVVQYLESCVYLITFSSWQEKKWQSQIAS